MSNGFNEYWKANKDKIVADIRYALEHYDEDEHLLTLICQNLYWEGATFTNGKKVKIEFPFFLCQGRLYGIALNIADHVMPWVKVLEGNSAAAEKAGTPQIVGVNISE